MLAPDCFHVVCTDFPLCRQLSQPQTLLVLLEPKIFAFNFGLASVNPKFSRDIKAQNDFHGLSKKPKSTTNRNLEGENAAPIFKLQRYAIFW